MTTTYCALKTARLYCYAPITFYLLNMPNTESAYTAYFNCKMWGLSQRKFALVYKFYAFNINQPALHMYCT